ncbi:hypothetical protein [Streptomyces sp. NPDC059063]|uniref:hypothetical protein n=1 Tax=unclassified Streptomyces TaxID=2593676 RepID=UPI0036C68D7C
MGNAGEGPAGPGGASREHGQRLVVDLLAELSRKVSEAGAEHVRVVTDEEVERERLRWFRAGWLERARERPEDTGPARIEPTGPARGSGHVDAAGRSDTRTAGHRDTRDTGHRDTGHPDSRGTGHPDTEGTLGPPVRVPGIPGGPPERGRPARVLRFPDAGRD